MNLQTPAIDGNPSHSIPQVQIDIDSLCGGQLVGNHNTCVAISTAKLQYLDVISCPSLTYLDLSQCQSGCHLTLRDCPSLQVIRVCDGGRGAVIHLDNGDQWPELQVHGAVDQMDACWTSGQFSVQSTELPWQGVWVSHHLAEIPVHSPSALAECWVLLNPEMTHAVIDAPWLRHCFISGGHRLHALSALSLHDKHSQLELQGLPELLSVDLHSSEGHCRIRECRSLTSLSGVINDLHMTQIARQGDALDLAVQCQRVVLSHSPLEELHLTEPTHLSLVHCASLEKVSLPALTSVHCEGPIPTPLIGVASVVVDESMVASLVNAYPHDPEAIMKKLAALIPSMSPSAPCVKALQLLHRLAELGASPEQVWQLRLALSAKHLAPHGKKAHTESQKQAIAQGHWKWALPDDLCREGWMADYHLWVLCASVVPEAYQFRRAMFRACGQHPDGLAMETIIHQMARRFHEAAQHEFDLWCEVLSAMVTKEPLSVTTWPRHARILTACYGCNSQWDRHYLTACETLLPLEVLMHVLTRLGVERPEIRTGLLRIAQQTDHWREQRCDSARKANHYRAKAMALAISRKS